MGAGFLTRHHYFKYFFLQDFELPTTASKNVILRIVLYEKGYKEKREANKKILQLLPMSGGTFGKVELYD